MSAYRPFEFLGAKWAILAEVDAEELNQPIVALRSTLLMVCTAVIVVIGFLGFLVARGIARPIGELTGVMSILADGNNEVDIPYTDLWRPTAPPTWPATAGCWSTAITSCSGPSGTVSTSLGSLMAFSRW